MRKIYFFLLALVAGATQLFADTEGALPGRFTINENGDVVVFSKGNAQYKASTNTWRFAENQYDYIGQANSNISDTYSGWIDLFAWGTGDNPTLATLDDKYYDRDLDDFLPYYENFVDWGKNRFSNGGNTANAWRTLTQAEWEYLLNHFGTTYAAASEAAFAGSIENIHGAFLLPDNYEIPDGVEYDDIRFRNFTFEEWQKLEAAGVVFLPEAGTRYGTNIRDVGTVGRYWIKDPSVTALGMNSESYFVSPDYWTYGSITDEEGYHECEYCIGLSVRLVQDAEPLPPPVVPITYDIKPAKYVIVASRTENADYYYMTADLGTASTKRFQAVSSGQNVLEQVPVQGLEDKYIWTVVADGENLRLKNGDLFVSWTSGNSAALDAAGKILKFTKYDESGEYTVSFENGSETRFLSFHLSSDYFAFYANTGQAVYLHFLPYEDGEPVDPPQPQSDNIVILAQRDASSNWFYMTSDLGTASNKRYQAVDAGTNDLSQVVTTNLDPKYYWQIQDNKLHTAKGYSTWSSGNSANLNNEGLDLNIQQADGFYTFSFADGSDTRYLSMNATAGNNYFAYYKGTGQIYKLKVLHEGDNNIPQALDQIDSSSLHGEERGRLILRKGQLLILRDGKTYTVTGLSSAPFH